MNSAQVQIIRENLAQAKAYLKTVKFLLREYAKDDEATAKEFVKRAIIDINNAESEVILSLE